MSRIQLPRGAETIISALERAGYEAYVVGGCVRDSLLGEEPHDWDICTSAIPSEIMECFSGKRIINTGMKHGTVTVLMNDGGYEVTTFRIDGDYSDSRHPDSVVFTSSLRKDLARRDFTMNAMAYNNHFGLIDPFGGEEALRHNVISCVGNAYDRFQEDALRIMRALRFAATCGFSIQEDTSQAIHRLAPQLKSVAAERIQSELNKLIFGKGALQVLLKYSDVMSVIIPEFAPCIGFDQNNPYHEYAIYDHIAHAVSNYTGNDLTVKLALLLHDIGKPQCYTEDERGGHFHGHGVPSRDIANVAMQRLRFDNRTREDVLTLVLYHDSVIEPTPRVVRRWLNKIGEQNFRRLLRVRMADIEAHAKWTQQSRIERCIALSSILDDIITQGQCFTMKNLNINGNDVMSLGVPEGKRVGTILNTLLGRVISGELENDHGELLDEANKLARKC